MTSNGKLAGRVAIHTGGTSGIGAATALHFAEEGAQVVLTGRRRERGEGVARQSRDSGGVCQFVQADHIRPEECSHVVDETLRLFGRLDVLFNNGGVITTGTAETVSEDDWHATLALNITAVWRMSPLAIAHMRTIGGGAIVNNVSDWGIVAARDALPYATSKGAVVLMTKSMALDHAHENIRVNGVCPGDTLVECWLEGGYFKGSDPKDPEEAMKESAAYLPLKRFAKPDEIAHAVLFLACDDSSFVTGHTLLVDGGNTAQ